MAGDWIQMRADLLTHPKIVRMSSALKADKLRVIGALHSVWCLFDMHSTDGQLEGYSPEVLDDYLGWTGFSAQMIVVKWLEHTADSLNVPRFDEHNGQSAKRRATETKRKRLAREAEALGGGKSSASGADTKRTREEKRRDREDIGGIPPIPPSAAAPLDATPAIARRQKIALADRDMPIPDWLPAEPWRAFEDTRWAKHPRTPYTLRAQEGIVKKLRDLLDQKHDLTQVLEASVRSGWTDVFAPRGSTGARINGAPAPLSVAGARTLENATRLAERLFSKEGTSHAT